MHNVIFSELAELASHLLPEWRPCGESMQLQLVALKVEQCQVETLNLDQHLHVSRLPQITKVRVVSKIANFLVVSSNKPACNQPLSSWALPLVQDCRPQGWGSQCFEPCAYVKMKLHYRCHGCLMSKSLPRRHQWSAEVPSLWQLEAYPGCSQTERTKMRNHFKTGWHAKLQCWKEGMIDYLGRNVGSRCFSEAVIEEKLAACLFSPLPLPLLSSLEGQKSNSLPHFACDIEIAWSMVK